MVGGEREGRLGSGCGTQGAKGQGGGLACTLGSRWGSPRSTLSPPFPGWLQVALIGEAMDVHGTMDEEQFIQVGARRAALVGVGRHPVQLCGWRSVDTWLAFPPGAVTREQGEAAFSIPYLRTPYLPTPYMRL